ncbi:MAG: glycosyltransferase family 4 protein [Phycisphaerales bacterium]
MSVPGANTRSISVTIVQPALPKYRVPVFRELAARPGIDLTVAYSTQVYMPNVAPDGFRGVNTDPFRDLLKRPHLHINPAQWAASARARSEVVVLTWDLHGLLLVPALLRARAAGVGTVVWGHGYSKQEGGLRRMSRNVVPRLADATMFYTDGPASRFVASGFPAGRVFVARNALDQRAIQATRAAWLADPEKLAAFRREHGLVDRPVALFVSRLEHDNRVDLLLRAAAKLRRELPGLLTVVIGKGPELESLQSLASELGLGDDARFLGAIYDEDEIAPWFLASRVFVYPRNIGLSLLHAFGYGLPAITCDDIASQNPEIEALRDGANGLLYRDGSLPAMVDSMRRIITDDALHSRLSAEAHRTVLEEFSLSRMVDGMEAAIRFAYARRNRLPLPTPWPITSAASAG